MRHLFITGTSRGLGLALAQRFATADTRVVGFSRTRGGFQGEYHACDLSRPESAANSLDKAFSLVDWSQTTSAVFVANSGILGPLDFIEKIPLEDIQENIVTNLIGSAVCLQRFLRATHALDGPRLFAQISSGAALPDRAKPAWSLYCACKSGQEQCVRAVAAEQAYAPRPAKIVNFNPGVMETDMQRLIRRTPKTSFPEVERFIELKETGQIPSSERVAQALSRLIEAYDQLENGATYQTSDFASP